VRPARVIRVSELPHVHDQPPSLRPLQLLRGPILALHRVRRRLWDGQADDLGVNTNQLHRWAAKYKHAELR
jgi:hypothetical protein